MIEISLKFENVPQLFEFIVKNQEKCDKTIIEQLDADTIKQIKFLVDAREAVLVDFRNAIAALDTIINREDK